MNTTYFKVEKMTVGYGRVPLISDIDVQLKRGEILTLIGPNGAGKTTILKSITRQLKMISGAVFLDGKSIEDMSGQELSEKMAVVLTDRIRTELYTCKDVVATGRYPYTGRFGVLTKKDWDAVNMAMEKVHILEIANQDFLAISDGQRQRVMLARAICQEPEILILDEPTSFLDIRHKLEFMDILQQMAAEGLSIVMSLHELDLAQRVSDKILCVKGECVDRIGNSEEIFADGYIRELYGLKKGSFIEKSGTLELAKMDGTPEVFVIAGGGCASGLYRELQRKRIPFATGILQENDLDYPCAKALAAKVITVEAFEEIGIDSLEEAKKIMDTCQRVYCPLEKFGKANDANRILKDYAMQTRKL